MARVGSQTSAAAASPDEQDCELDEEFLQRLNSTLERNDIHDSWQTSQTRWRRCASELAKWIWYLAGLYSQIDLFGGHQEDPTNRHYWRWSHHENFDRRFTKARLLWWPYVSLPLYTISSLRLLTNIYYQYKYDFNFIRQQVFLALTGSQTNRAENVSSLIKLHMDSPFVQTILIAQERSASAPAPASASAVPPTMLNFSSSTLANTSNQQRPQLLSTTGVHNHLSPLFEPGRPKVLAMTQSENQPTTSPLDEIGTLLNTRVAEAYDALKCIGAPYIVMTFEVQIVYFFLLMSSFVLVVLIRLYYRHYSPFDFSLVRAVLDFKHERRLFNRLIVHELNRFVLSSRNFTQACVEQSQWRASGTGPNWRHSNPSSNRSSSDENKTFSIAKAHARRADANRFMLNHALIKKQLQQMAMGGQLLPEHRTARWVESLSLKFVLFALGTMAYIFSAVIFFAFVFFALSERVFMHILSYMDVLTICDAGVLVALIVPIGVIQIVVMVANCLDQIRYSTSVCHQIRECIQVNQRRFIEICEMYRQQADWRRRPILQQNNFSPHYEHSSSSLSYGRLIGDSKRALVMRRQSGTQSARATCVGGDPFELFKDDRLELYDPAPDRTFDQSLSVASRYAQMNVDLLRVFVTYKIFVAQMRQTTRAFVTFTLACVSLIIISPVMVRIHSPYFSQFTKIMSMLFSLLGTTVVDACLILLCYMFARCTEIYRCLSSLLAHAVEVMNCAPGSSTRFSLTSADESEFSPPLEQPSELHTIWPEQQQQQQLYVQQIYDTHTIWLLRKELNFPDRVVSQFAIVAFDFRLTYSNLLKIHFWLGLLTLSIFVDGSSTREFFGRLFDDPLGVFDWP